MYILLLIKVLKTFLINQLINFNIFDCNIISCFQKEPMRLYTTECKIVFCFQRFFIKYVHSMFGNLTAALEKQLHSYVIDFYYSVIN